MAAETSTALRMLGSAGIPLAPGLTDDEVAAVETRYGFRYPPDLRELLQAAIPTGSRFPDWRASDAKHLTDWMQLPKEGVLFDIEHNDFWMPDWPQRPTDVASAKQLAADLIAAAPKLVPVYAHRMMPDESHLRGNPIFSVHQTDIICYGRTLAEYLHNEFERAEPGILPQDHRPIRFWDIQAFGDVRWDAGPVVFDNSRGGLP